MDTLAKLKILSAASQYDLACACGTHDQDHRRRGTDGKWLYPVTLAGGGRAIMLKTLLSNACTNDCKYCPLRRDTNIRRCALNPDETARTFMDYLARRNIFGLFLSSGVIGSPDRTMEQLNAVAALLRRKHRFRGYIHLKIIPGASDAAIRETLSLASAVSINIETPGEAHCRKLSGRKRFLEDIIHPLKLVARLTAKGERYARIRTTTQFVVGASDETDAEIVNYMFGLYDRLRLNRVYFSAYQAGLGAPDIPGETGGELNPQDRLRREHRLYQVDFLIRKYGFKTEDIPFDRRNNLSLDQDPKEHWAALHPEFYPIKVNQADRETLLRVPGLGLLTVARLLDRRREGRLNDLQGMNLRGHRLQKALAHIRFD
ncbi:MAG: radical SAM protein [Verrucomicrobia bacterium]|nr:radical SAM protein [Verrucomicrobiota bacterium]MBU4428249.1 radical SAM protein [Verrucomicrobiota bacterium]MCG2679548.1 radical SAM protein [Kiritimatiellia bacterium]